MAKKSFLTPDELKAARNHWGGRPNGADFSLWLENTLLEKWQKSPFWDQAGPIALGSWARNELCPGSDLDLLFVGSEEKASLFIGEQLAQGIRIRARIPAAPEDWTLGVEPFDVLALAGARPLVEWVKPQLEAQQISLQRTGKKWRRQVFRAIVRERAERTRRHDSVTHYLEPNLKYGPGGLRDLQQSIDLISLFPERFYDLVERHGVVTVFEKAKAFYLSLRQQLHLLAGGEVLSAGIQGELAQSLRYSGSSEMMKRFQQTVAEVSFYARWVMERVQGPLKPQRPKIKSAGRALKMLDEDSSLERQVQVYESLGNLEADRSLLRYFKSRQSEQFMEAIFRSHLLDLFVSELRPLRGLVQHDHYHRFTADEHLLQVCKEVLRIKKKPSRLLHLKGVARELSEDDWDILLWVALFHDIGKGRGGDHAIKGRAIFARCGAEIGLSVALIEEVGWMVEHHLLLSKMAFRGNPSEPNQWTHLEQMGARPERMRRLLVFTALDILGTNPDAWNEWKARLLSDLFKAVTSSRAVNYVAFVKKLEKLGLGDLAPSFDPSLVGALPQKLLLDDLRRASRSRGDLDPLVVRNRHRETWVRFHRKEDRPGVFLGLSQMLYASALPVRTSLVMSLKGIGVYDWFQVRTNLKTDMVIKRLKSVRSGEARAAIVTPAHRVHFERIEVVSSTRTEVVLSWRGKDQKGLLLAAAQALYDHGLTIRWARVHTWGQQIDDVFAVDPHPNIDKIIERVREQFCPEQKA